MFLAESAIADAAITSIPRGMAIGDDTILPLDPAAARSLLPLLDDALGTGAQTVPFAAGEALIQVPATAAAREIVAQIAGVAETRLDHSNSSPLDDVKTQPSADQLVLLIQPNEETLDLETNFKPRPDLAADLPTAVRSSLKPHQEEGLSWLQACWRAGRPGVLLADDMGLGKTLQSLAFLAWLRDGMDRRLIPHKPMLIVAPTGLLMNWQMEVDKHLSGAGLGTLLRAYGPDLKHLRRQDGAAGTIALDTDALAAADWVITTYETLRDHDQSFGSVAFAALLMDEAQKIKSPGIRLTDAAKAVNADFKIAITGTPVENRLADLWCIVDAVHPGYLEDLKTFSRKYEANPTEECLVSLKAQLDQPLPGRPPLLLRRRKEDRLKDVPEAQQHVIAMTMPSVQEKYYRDAISSLRADENRKGAHLKALQAIRAISLHPDPEGETNDDGFIAQSARLIGAFQALDAVKGADEAALVFLDDLDVQGRLSGILQRRYRLKRPPDIINGAVAGAKRQLMVDRFQGEEGFGVIMLSPKAGGVGLTLTRATHVIHLHRWWNPAVEDQCNGRALRIGQTRTVHIHLPLALLTGASSFDQKLHELLEKKRELSRRALIPPMTDGDLSRLADSIL